jgi:rSAM/selenodomain-associated transferase 2
MISVIIPTWNEEGEIEGCLRSLREQGGDLETIVVDGGSRDRTLEIASRYSSVIQAGRGRALQMNAGARRAGGEILLFLHADSRLPQGWKRAVEEAVRNGAVGGAFRLRLDDSSPFFRTVAALANLRARLTGTYLGDHGLFVSREAFEAVGGFREIPLMEDVELCRRLREVGPLVQLREEITSSARRLKREGVGRTLLRMQLLRLLYWIGAPPERLHRWYGGDGGR